jgi:hypothetical protein
MNCQVFAEVVVVQLDDVEAVRNTRSSVRF